jgi:hypothetical protein
LDTGRVNPNVVFEQNPFLIFIERNVLGTAYAFSGCFVQLEQAAYQLIAEHAFCQDLSDILHLRADVADPFGFDDNQGAAFAEAMAAGPPDRDPMPDSLLVHLLFESIGNFFGAISAAPRAAADRDAERFCVALEDELFSELYQFSCIN